MIQGRHDRGQLLLGDSSQILVFREKLTEQAIRVFVHASFPGRIRMGKINLSLQLLRHAEMLTEFQAIVIRDRVHLGFVGLQPTGDGLAHRRRRFVGHTFEDRVFGDPFHHRDQGSSMAFADDRISLPVANTHTGCHHGRSFIIET